MAISLVAQNSNRPADQTRSRGDRRLRDAKFRKVRQLLGEADSARSIADRRDALGLPLGCKHLLKRWRGRACLSRRLHSFDQEGSPRVRLREHIEEVHEALPMPEVVRTREGAGDRPRTHQAVKCTDHPLQLLDLCDLALDRANARLLKSEPSECALDSSDSPLVRDCS
jgi:hypothetical protein